MSARPRGQREKMSSMKVSEYHDNMPSPAVSEETAVAHFERNTDGRDFVVGDIHGMFSHLEALLDRVEFDEASDRLFSVGDLVDRGPESADALKWLERPWFHAVRGNHEQFVIDSENPEQVTIWINYNGGEWWLGLDASEQEAFRRAFSEMPLAMEVETESGRVGIVHADVPPFISWEHFLSLLKARDRDATLYAIWSRNRITGHGASRPVSGDVERIYCGHTPTRMIVQLENVYYIDTGAVYALEGYDEAKLTIVEISPAAHREFDILTIDPV